MPVSAPPLPIPGNELPSSSLQAAMPRRTTVENTEKV
jgi:hypothetical protein